MQLIAKKVLRAIVKEVKNDKYFSIIVDSTSDVTHVDQLAVIIRYVQEKSGEPVERFLEFIPPHKVWTMSNVKESFCHKMVCKSWCNKGS